MKNKISIWILACLTIGLLPYPEPHIIGKINWVLGGGLGMELKDWVDLVMHGTPWIGLLIVLITSIRKNFSTSGNINT